MIHPVRQTVRYTQDARVTTAIGELIRTADAGDGAAADQLFSALYGELHGLAERQLRRSGPDVTLGTTTLSRSPKRASWVLTATRG